MKLEINPDEAQALGQELADQLVGRKPGVVLMALSLVVAGVCANAPNNAKT